MTLLSKTGLEEYARQCTLQRRRYEDCLQQAQQDNTADGEQLFEDSQLDRHTQQATQSCMAELLELPVHPLDWDDESSVLDETKKAIAEEHQWQHDRSQRPHQSVTNSTRKSAHHVSYGAP